VSSLSVIGGMLALGLAAGVLGGLFGIGGGLVIVPALTLFFGLDQKTATGTSLFALLWPVGLLGVVEYYRRGELRLDAGAWIAFGLFLGAYFGAWLTGHVSGSQLKRAYGVFLIVVGLYYTFATTSAPSPQPLPTPVSKPRAEGH
jgi:uncharacterized membrane protein YfcA